MATICDDDKIVVFGGTDSSKDLADTWIYHCSLFSQMGTFTSKAFDTGRATPFGEISWNGSVSSETYLKFQIRTTALKTELDSEKFVGPDGSRESYYTQSPYKIWSGHNNHRWIQFKAYFGTIDEDDTPVLKNITVSYNIRPGKPILIGPANNSWMNNSKPEFSWEYNGSTSDIPGGFQWQLDNHKDFSSIDYDSNKVRSGIMSYTPTKSIKDGTWYWRVRTQDYEGYWGSYSDYYIIKIDTNILKPVSVTISPNKWSSNTDFIIDWTLPDDQSGIKMGAYYFINASEPTSQKDGVWSDDKPLLIEQLRNGKTNIYIWLEDNVGNVDFQNYTFATFKVDTSNPLISHKPVNKWDVGEKIIINAEVIDEHAGIDQVFLYYKNPKDNKYSYFQMDKIGRNYTAEIPGILVNQEGISYYIKAADKSTPNNVVYFCRSGLTKKEPTVNNDFDISIPKKESEISDLYWYIIILIIVIIIIIIISIYFIKKRKPLYDQTEELNLFRQPNDETTLALYPSQPSSSVTPATMPMQTHSTPPMQQGPPRMLQIYKCRLCGANITNPNKCPYCGWVKQ
jgi:hypothetical protein